MEVKVAFISPVSSVWSQKALSFVFHFRGLAFSTVLIVRFMEQCDLEIIKGHYEITPFHSCKSQPRKVRNSFSCALCHWVRCWEWPPDWVKSTWRWLSNSSLLRGHHTLLSVEPVTGEANFSLIFSYFLTLLLWLLFEKRPTWRELLGVTSQ